MFNSKIDEVSILVLGFIILLIAIAGCTPETVNNYYLDADVEVVMEDNGDGGAEEPADDDDSGEEPVEPSDDDDSAEDDEEPQDAALEIRFLTYANDGPFTVFAGDEDVVLGRYLFTASGAVTVRRLFAPVVFNPTPEEMYGVYDLNEEEVAQHVESCVMVNTATGFVIAGPAWPGLNGVFEFVDQFTLVDEQLILEFRCDMTSAEPEGTYNGLSHLFFGFEEVVDANGEPVYPAIAGHNGTAWAPVLHAILTETPVEYPSIEFALSPVSPSGAAVPWWGTSVMVFTATAYGADITIETLSFDTLSSDNTATWWNRCSGFGSGGIHLHDVSESSPEPLGTWTSQTPNGVCPGASGPVTMAEAYSVGFTVAEGTTATFQVTVDAQGASSATDDVLQLSLGGAGVSSDEVVEAITGLPLVGGILQF